MKRGVLLSVLLSLCMVTNVFAGTDYVSMVRKNESNGTEGVYTTEGTWVTTTPLFSTCYVTCEAKSAFDYSRNGTGIKKKFKKHSITTRIGGIGNATIGAGTEFESDSNEATITAKTWNWEFQTVASIWRLFSYSQMHTLQYELVKNGKSITTVTLTNTAVY